MDPQELEKLLKTMPENGSVPVDRLPDPDKKPEAETLDEDEKAIAVKMGVSPDEFLKAKHEIDRKEEVNE